jgi:flagellar assembly protein FliH
LRSFTTGEVAGTDGSLRFGERVLRGDRAGLASSADFDVDLRQRSTLPSNLISQLRTEAHAAGYASGWAQGRREARVAADAEATRTANDAQTAARTQETRVAQAVNAVASAAANLERRAVAGAAEMEDAIVAAAFALATAIVGRELATATEPGRDAITRALALSPVNRPVLVRLHPADLATVGATGSLDIDGRTVTLAADASLRPGDAIAECDATTVDARISEALDRVREALQV